MPIDAGSIVEMVALSEPYVERYCSTQLLAWGGDNALGVTVIRGRMTFSSQGASVLKVVALKFELQ